MGDNTIALLALAGIGGAAYMMSGNGKSSERNVIDTDLYNVLVGEGIEQETAREIIEQTPAETPFKQKFFGAILRGAADEYLLANRADYVQ